ncbi:hypothetical protein [Sphingomonas sp.]|uniref:hypothetical protein n=1 Tax=Sphingomonas sp. TaxID=28214 RepID=UPI003CC51C98
MPELKGGRYISAPCTHDTLRAIESYAAENEVALGQAALHFIEHGIEAVARPVPLVPAGEPHDGSIGSIAAWLEHVPNASLTAEVARRIDEGISDEDYGAAVARAEDAEAQIAAVRLALAGGGGGAVSPFTTSTARDGDVVRLTVMLTTDPGPAREFRPFLEVELDEPHAVMLFGELGLALQSFTDERAGGTVVAFPGGGR